MDTLAMHRTLLEAGFKDEQADAILKVVQGGVATKHDLDLAVVRLEGRIDRLDAKVNLMLAVAVLSVLAPAITRLVIA